GFPDKRAGAIYGLYCSMAYLMCLGGGWVADRITGQRRAVLMGGVLIAAGEFSLVAPSAAFFYLGLVLLMVGTGMLKGTVSTIVGQLYRQGDVRRDSGFSIFYMGINTGALISPLACGWVAERWGWRMGFGLAGVAMLAGVVQYILSSSLLGAAGLHPATTGDPKRDRRQKRSATLAVGAGLAVLALFGILAGTGAIQLTPDSISDGVGYALVGISVVVFVWLIFGKQWSHTERKRSAAILVLFVASAVFWAAFEQAGSSLNLFGERSTIRNLFGYQYPAAWFQSVQPIFVIAFAPVFAWLWLALGKREPAIPTKFTLGLFLGGAAFAVMVPAANMALGGHMVSQWWLNSCYFLQTMGELCLSPVGLSAMTKLAPERAAGFMMGMWFVSISIGNWLAGKAASLYSSMPLPTLFGVVAVFSILAAIVMCFMIKPTVRMMSGVK
ncbi:MAG TPA: peptide MFS transporter, partial [Candidatus Sulfopaludibacter sp.]|nr:peptide MFS transporter [Candidatus Sulfopaludibacter sp.]